MIHTDNILCKPNSDVVENPTHPLPGAIIQPLNEDELARRCEELRQAGTRTNRGKNNE